MMAASPKDVGVLLELASVETPCFEDVNDPFTNDADEWEEGSLPAIPMVPFYTQQDFVDVIPQPQKDKNAVASRAHGWQGHSNDQYGPQLKGQPGRLDDPGRSPFTYGQPASYRPEIGGISSRRRGIQTRQVQHGGSVVDNAAYASYHRKEQHGGEYTFSQDWRQLLSDLHGDKTRMWAQEELNRLSRQTGTFIPMPADHSTTAYIWGDSAQVAYARVGLEEFERAIRKEHAEKRRDLGKWEKINALDGRKEHREERRAKVEEFAAQHGRLESSAEFTFEYWFLWPSRDLEFEQISSSNLQGLRKNFLCAVDYDSTTSFVRIMANKERNLLQVVQRIINLVKEMVAELNQVTKLNLLQLPSKSVYRSSVSMEKKESVLAIPKLEGMTLSMIQSDHWEDSVRDNRRSNRKEVGKAVETCLKSLRLSQKRVRMRINLGQLAFKQYQLPSDDKKHYRFDEFRTMLENDRTLLELHGLLRGADTDDIVDRCASHAMFINPVETHAVHIEFNEPDKPTTLRLEKKFTVSHDYRDVFIEGHEWLEYPSGSEGSLLEVNMLDFEKLDWQMTINAVSIFEQRTSVRDLFQTNVILEPTSDDKNGKPKLKGEAQRRAFFKLDGPKPTLVIELTTLTYDLSNTDAKLELVRRDEYLQTQFGTEAGPPVSRLFASFYYTEWNRLMGEYTYLQPGGQVEWLPSLSTFFPDENRRGKPKGLKKFMELITEVQQVLSGKPVQADGNQTESLLIDLPNGVGNTNH